MLCQTCKNKTCLKTGVPCKRVEKHLKRFEVSDDDADEPKEAIVIECADWHLDDQAEDFTPTAILSNYYMDNPHTMAEVASYHSEPDLKFYFLSRAENKACHYLYHEGLSCPQIAIRMKRSTSAVKSALARARKKFRTLFPNSRVEDFFSSTT